MQIYEQGILKRIIEKFETERLESKECRAFQNAFLWEMAQDIVKTVAIECSNGWIPVSERLPEEPKENPVFENKELELYLVSVKNQDYAFRAFWNGKSFTDGWSKLDVIAWMPLPEPYNPEEGNQ